MPDFRQSGEKPMRPQDHLGLDVTIDREVLENDTWAQNMLKEIGKTMTPDQHTYMGSMALHFYKTANENLVTRSYDVATKQQLTLGDLNEYLANMGLSNLLIEVKRHFGRVHKTTDGKDRRGQGAT